jgi:hypothetical protein
MVRQELLLSVRNLIVLPKVSREAIIMLNSYSNNEIYCNNNMSRVYHATTTDTLTSSLGWLKVQHYDKVSHSDSELIQQRSKGVMGKALHGASQCQSYGL